MDLDPDRPTFEGWLARLQARLSRKNIREKVVEMRAARGLPAS
ncbi:hypothetical protein GCM10009555_046870 [Acrocarpospora macrocephala]|uniref:Uncharacterized protein n=1 Tax=Acrocarpospora macrocephala TaxID=150177 RepID=A0A5M3WVL1_9ACTN|nr:hypothetical protein [Acrocarpospora macrocephala]GES12029.1 hypothetical protein Amac_056260 [Acrocarpospora macrocephala]